MLIGKPRGFAELAVRYRRTVVPRIRYVMFGDDLFVRVPGCGVVVQLRQGTSPRYPTHSSCDIRH
eukprot:778099-Rhodomonas_salina.1